MTTHFDVNCPKCDQGLKVRTKYAGQRVRCQKCERSFVVPDPPAASESVEATELDQVKSELNLLRDDLESKMQIIGDMKKEKDKLTASCKELSEQVEAEDQAQSEFKDLQTALDLAKSENDQLKQQIGEFEQDRAAQREAIEAELGAAGNRTTLLETELESAHSQLQAMLEQHQQTVNELSLAKEQWASTETRASELEESHGLLMQQLEAAQKETADLTLSKESLEATQKERASDGELLQELQEKSERFKSGFEQMEQQVEALQQQVELANKTRLAAEDRADETVQSRQQLQDELDRTEDEREDLQEKVDSLSKLVGASPNDTETDDLRQQLEAAQNEIEKLSSQSTGPGEADAKSDDSSEIHELKTELEKAHARYEQLKSMVTGMGISL